MKTLLEYLRLFMFRWFGYDPKPNLSPFNPDYLFVPTEVANDPGKLQRLADLLGKPFECHGNTYRPTPRP